jgi:hypothetical protein
MKKLNAETLNPCHWALAGKTAVGSHEVANRDLGEGRDRLPQGSSEGGADWEICESNERERTSQKLK